MKTLGQRMMNGKAYYVAQLPSRSQDWGWTKDPRSATDPAINLSPYWQRRFLAIRHYSKDALQLLTVD